MQVNTRYIHSTKGTSGGGYVLCIYKGCTSGGVYVHCIYSHARWGLSQATPVFVVALVWHHPSTNFNSLVCLTILHGYSGHCSISNCNHISTQIVVFLGHWTFYRNRLAEDLRKLFRCIIYLHPEASGQDWTRSRRYGKSLHANVPVHSLWSFLQLSYHNMELDLAR